MSLADVFAYEAKGGTRRGRAVAGRELRAGPRIRHREAPIEKTHNLTEHAGAAALKIRDRLAGKKVVLVVSGGNLRSSQLRAALDRHGEEQA